MPRRHCSRGVVYDPACIRFDSVGASPWVEARGYDESRHAPQPPQYPRSPKCPYAAQLRTVASFAVGCSSQQSQCKSGDEMTSGGPCAHPHLAQSRPFRPHSSRSRYAGRWPSPAQSAFEASRPAATVLVVLCMTQPASGLTASVPPPGSRPGGTTNRVASPGPIPPPPLPAANSPFTSPPSPNPPRTTAGRRRPCKPPHFPCPAPRPWPKRTILGPPSRCWCRPGWRRRKPRPPKPCPCPQALAKRKILSAPLVVPPGLEET